MNGTATQGCEHKHPADSEASQPEATGTGHGLLVSGQTPIPGLKQLLRGMGKSHCGHREGDYANVGLVDRFLASCPVQS